MSRLKRVTKLVGIVFWRVSAMRRVLRSCWKAYDFAYATSEKGHEVVRDNFLICVRNEKGHSAVGRHMILHMSRVKRITKLFGIVFWRVSAMKRVTQLLEGI